MRIGITSVLMLVLIVAGCENDSYVKRLEEQNLQLQQANRQLNEQLQQYAAENEQLDRQIEVLSSLGRKKRIENLYQLQDVKLSRYTNFYDKDRDGKKDTLIVYIQPIDAEGDAIKAAGQVDVELWDLNRTDSEAMLAKWHIEPAELKKVWSASLIKANYRLKFDISDVVSSFDQQYTVKVTFIDYLSGKVFIKQRVIKP